MDRFGNRSKFRSIVAQGFVLKTKIGSPSSVDDGAASRLKIEGFNLSDLRAQVRAERTGVKLAPRSTREQIDPSLQWSLSHRRVSWQSKVSQRQALCSRSRIVAKFWDLLPGVVYNQWQVEEEHDPVSSE